MAKDKPFRLEVSGVQFNLTAPPADDMTPQNEEDMAHALSEWFKESVGPNPGCPVFVQVNDGPPRRYILRGITYPAPDRAVVHLEAEAVIEGYTIKIDSDGVTGTLASREGRGTHEQDQTDRGGATAGPGDVVRDDQDDNTGTEGEA